ncbi:MAG: hypothetical protein QXI60_10655 [Thermofilaceae archaeon]
MIDASILLSAALFFVLGLIVGLIVRRVAEAIILALILLFLLSITGLISASPPDILRETLPWLIEAGKLILSILPYASVAFIIGLVIGLLKG